jgi:hypothetical protein
MIDEQPWQVEKTCHPGDHGDDMGSLQPNVDHYSIA